MKHEFVITGPLLSVNKMYATPRGRSTRRLTVDGKHFKYKVAVLFSETCGPTELLQGDLVMVINYTFPRDNRDVTNYDKAILDALKGRAYYDDKQIRVFMATKRVEKGSDSAKVTIARLQDVRFLMVDCMDSDLLNTTVSER